MTPPPRSRRPKTPTPPDIAALRDRVLGRGPDANAERETRRKKQRAEREGQPLPEGGGTTRVRTSWWVRLGRWLRGGS